MNYRVTDNESHIKQYSIIVECLAIWLLLFGAAKRRPCFTTCSAVAEVIFSGGDDRQSDLMHIEHLIRFFQHWTSGTGRDYS